MVNPNKVIETAAGGNLALVIQKLASLTIDEVSKLRISDSIDWLKDELQLIRAVLEDLSHDEHPTEQDKLWKNKIRELAYDMEDAIDEFMLRSNNTPPPGGQDQEEPGFIKTIRSCTERIKRLPSDYGMATKIQRLKEKVKSLEGGEPSKRQKIGANGDAGSSHGDSIALRWTAQLPALPSDLVGTKGPSDQIIGLLLKDKDEASWSSSAGPCKVVAIVGFGGLGKTTLARQVFNTTTAMGIFPLKAFVTVSQDPDIKTVLLNILEAFGLGNEQLQQLRQKSVPGIRIAEKLREYFGANRYLVVLDDIWSKDVWIKLKAALVNNNCDSKIIVTTRNDEVATACCSSNRNNHVYRMQPLSYEDSKLLFLKKRFHGKECPPNLKVVCHEILKKCNGSPLAIVVLSGMLASKVTEWQWRNVLKTINSGDSEYNVVGRIISLSYFDLPQHLRTCLMYLSIFPEDFKISRKRLVNRWIAEGFVKCIDGISITETAERYFGDLISRNLIQAVDIKYDGEARACRVHDTILYFIKNKSCEENFVSINGLKSRSGNKVRRLSIQNYQDAKERLAVAAEDLSHIRSITLFGYSEHMPCHLSLRGYPNLRVIDAKDAFPYEEGAESSIDIDVALLPHLKYLDLSGLSLCELPEEFYTQRVLTAIGNLQYLETLDLRGAEVVDLPTDIYKLRRLVRLFISQYMRLPNNGIGQLKALEELKCVWISECSSVEFLQELGQLTKMGSMHIRIADGNISDEQEYISEEQELVLVSSLQKLSNLRSLRIELDDTPAIQYGISWRSALQGLRKLSILDVGLQAIFEEVPGWMGTLNALEKLVLRVEVIEQNHMDILGELQSLLYLKLTSRWKQGLFMDNKGFQSLKYLNFFCGHLTFKAGSVPRLEKLDLTVTSTIYRNAPGGHVLVGIEYLDSLTTVNVISDLDTDTENNVKNAITNAANRHPKKPTLTIH